MKVKVLVAQSCLTLWDPMDCGLCSWNCPGQNTGVGSHFLLQGIFLTQGSNPGLPHCRQILYQLSLKGSPRILEWVAYSFSSRIFLTQELNWGLLHCRRILYQLNYQGSTIIQVFIKSPNCSFTQKFSGFKWIQNILYPSSERPRNAHSQFTVEEVRAKKEHWPHY